MAYPIPFIIINIGYKKIVWTYKCAKIPITPNELTAVIIPAVIKIIIFTLSPRWPMVALEKEYAKRKQEFIIPINYYSTYIELTKS